MTASPTTPGPCLATRDDRPLVELVVVAGFYRMVSGFLNSAGVQLDAGVPGWPEGAFGSDKGRPDRGGGAATRREHRAIGCGRRSGHLG